LELSLKNHLTLSERASEIIEASILEGSIKPGERIIEISVAKMLGISKSPVREALKKLEGDGIVQRISRKGYIAKNIGLKDINDFFEIMFIFEPMVAKLALKKKQETRCVEIDSILTQMKDALNKNDYNRYILLNRRFHSIFYEFNENIWVTKISQMLYKESSILSSLSFSTIDRLARSLEEHITIADAYKKGDPKLLTKAVACHLETFRKNIFKSLRLGTDESSD